ncbi:MAG: NgoPII family restriction endonuclease, partial [Cyanobacteria bacterium P01_D01_bin.116]
LAFRNQKHSEAFSYIGNQNNPPDLILKNGDAIEVKKIESLKSSIALNSSYPKSKLHSDEPMLTSYCRNCEDWQEKDIIYAIGIIKDKKLKLLWLIYGDCYAADREVYKRIANTINTGINEIKDVEFSETKELGRVNKVDPLGITYLRIRGMWGIQNPISVYDYLFENIDIDTFQLIVIMKEEKYLSFPYEVRKFVEAISDKNFIIKNVNIKSPNNPAQLIPAKMINYKVYT